MTGREYLVNQSILHIMDNFPERLSDTRVWEVIEGVIHNVQYHINANYAVDSKVLRYWDTIADPDGKAATRLVNDIIRGVNARIKHNGN